jgi:uncharacterized membrane protein HdeD (DUF308 family)
VDVGRIAIHPFWVTATTRRRRRVIAGWLERPARVAFTRGGAGMATLEWQQTRSTESEPSSASWWWLFLVTGIAWLMLSLVVLRFDITSVFAVGVMLGVVLSFAAFTEVGAALAVPGWRWAHWLLAVLFGFGAVWAFVHPIGAFWELASILGFLLVLKGSLDIIGSVISKQNELWRVGLMAGIVEILLAFWVSQQYFEPRAELIIVWVGFMAILRGIGQIVLAFSLRRVTVTENQGPSLPAAPRMAIHRRL